MDCAGNDWVCTALNKIGLSGLPRQIVRFLLDQPLKLALVLLLAVIGARVGSRVAQRSVTGLAGRTPLRQPSARADQRARTLAGVAASVVRIFVWTVAGLLMLDVVGLNLGPLVAGASVVGVALAFGAQSLVRDFLSGFFVLVEDQFGVGDVITIADTTGTVEEINLRVTRLRATDGTVWFVPNGEIRKVGNSAKEWARALVDVVLSNKADLSAATAAIAEEAAGVARDPAWVESILEEPEVLGVESVGVESVTVRVSVKVAPAARAVLARELRTRISARLQRDGVVSSEPSSSTG